MARAYDRDEQGEAHRDLVLSDAFGFQRGDDVKKAASAALRRLTARGINRKAALAPLIKTGELSRDGFEALVTAARLLGAREDTLSRKDSKDRRILTVGVQDMIRYPGRRTPDQEQRGEDRMAKLVAERKKRAAEAAARARESGGVSGLPTATRIRVRTKAVYAMRAHYLRNGAVHYTQGGARWSYIQRRVRTAQGQIAYYADCSSLTTGALWDAFTSIVRLSYPDVVNGASWNYGYTGSQTQHGVRVTNGQLQVGDLVFYGGSFSIPGHVAMYAGGGMVYSHGSERGPNFIPWNYRPVVQIRRYI